MKKLLLLAATASLALASPAFAQDAGSSGMKAGTKAEQTQLRPADRDFIEKAGIGGLFEVQSSELAEDKAQSADVKQFARQMIRDHGKANTELKSAAQDLGAQVPAKLDSKHQQALQKLEGAQKGAAFDRVYIQAQRDAHREAVNLFSNYAKSNGALASWAQKTLPVLQEHQQHVQRLGGMAEGTSPEGMGRSAAEPSGAPMPQKREPMQQKSQ